jgi:hypothetical protein
MGWMFNQRDIGWRAEQLPESIPAASVQDNAVTVLIVPQNASDVEDLWIGDWARVPDSSEKRAAMAADALRAYLNSIGIITAARRFVTNPTIDWPLQTVTPPRGTVIALVGRRLPIADLYADPDFLKQLEKALGYTP